MDNITNLINCIKIIELKQVIDIIVALLIYILFRCLSKSFSYITIKIFKPKIKNKKEIKNNPFYKPLILFYIILGAYIAILFIKTSLNINDNIILIANKILKLSIIILLANGISNSLTIKGKFINKIRQHANFEVDDPMFNIILKILRAVIYVVAGFLVITELGYNLNGLVAGLGIGSVVITLAAQDTAKNLFGGLVIFLDRPFMVGDWIQVDKYEGTIEDITFRSTRVRTFENSVVNIPNAVISNDSIINWSRMEKRRNKLNLCLELDTPLQKVQIVQSRIKEMLMQHDDVIDDTIIVRFDEIKDNGLNLLVSSYTNSIDYLSFLEEKEKINYKIMQILAEEKVELAYDTKTINIKK